MDQNYDHKIKKYQYKYSKLMKQQAGQNAKFTRIFLFSLGQQGETQNRNTQPFQVPSNLQSYLDFFQQSVKNIPGTISYVAEDGKKIDTGEIRKIRKNLLNVLGQDYKMEIAPGVKCPSSQPCKVLWVSDIIRIDLNKIPSIKAPTKPLLQRVDVYFDKMKKGFQEMIEKIKIKPVHQSGGDEEKKLNWLTSLTSGLNELLKTTGLQNVGEKIGELVHTGVATTKKGFDQAIEFTKGLNDATLAQLPAIGPYIKSGIDTTGDLLRKGTQYVEDTSAAYLDPITKEKYKKEGEKLYSSAQEALSSIASPMKNAIKNLEQSPHYRYAEKKIKEFADSPTFKEYAEKLKDAPEEFQKIIRSLSPNPQSVQPTTVLPVTTGGRIHHKKGSKKIKHHKKKHMEKK